MKVKGTVEGADGKVLAGQSCAVSPSRIVTPVLVAVAWRPWLWFTALLEALRMARPGWWRRWPPLPLPDSALWAFRLETVLGGEELRAGSPVALRQDAGPALSAKEVREHLEWCRQLRAEARR